MEALTLQAPQSETLITDEEFDLMLGELELDAPEHSENPSTCAINHIYCAL
ncbi:MAG: hypothetical protein HOV87_36035 [Catenulispora sp.]|nr:hypothetical protein [Catenulispora sp.]